MPKLIDKTGKRYGRLLVISYAGKTTHRDHTWHCLCDCGGTKIVRGGNLASNKSRSCGCLQREFLAKNGARFGLEEDRELALLKQQYSHLKKRHKLKKWNGDVLPFQSFVKKAKSPCKYCGIKYSKEIEDRFNESRNKKRLSDYVLKVNGLDRVDSDLGYTDANTSPCCTVCNFAKRTMPVQEFYAWLKRVCAHNKVLFAT